MLPAAENRRSDFWKAPSQFYTIFINPFTPEGAGTAPVGLLVLFHGSLSSLEVWEGEQSQAGALHCGFSLVAPKQLQGQTLPSTFCSGFQQQCQQWNYGSTHFCNWCTWLNGNSHLSQTTSEKIIRKCYLFSSHWMSLGLILSYFVFPQWQCTESHPSMTWQSSPAPAAARPPRAGAPRLCSTGAKPLARTSRRSPVAKPRPGAEPRNLTSSRAWIQADFSHRSAVQDWLWQQTTCKHPDIIDKKQLFHCNQSPSEQH